jgi:hypothetical protein
MNNHGSLKSLLLLWKNLATNQRYSSYVQEADLKTFETRANNEGLTFLTVTLPKLGKALDAFHSTLEWTCPEGFHVIMVDPSGRLIPEFLRYAVQAALEGDSKAVDCVRQLSLIFYKYEVNYDDITRERFLDQFKITDAGLPLLSFAEGDNSPTARLIREMRRLISKVLCNTDPRNIRPSHGGGATACHTRNEDKHHTLRYFAQLDAIYPYDDLFFYSPSHLIDSWERLEKSPVGVPKARVCLVPKDSRGPRVISCEPAELMYAQQGLMNLLYGILETHPMTTGRVNFTDQTINRKLACQSSITGMFATIDLKDASDRVSLDLVEQVFPQVWVDCFKACRSDTTVLPGGSEVRLRKFAPMGSACCFPVEALVFWACAEAIRRTIILSEHRSNSNLERDPRLACQNGSETYVYGDDIIVRSHLYGATVEGLESIGLIVNKTKSYAEGPFRESCGGDYHRGVDVTPVRVRKPLLSSGLGVIYNADLANLFMAKFGEKNSWSLVHTIEEAINYIFPRTLLPLPGTLRVEPALSNDVFFLRRWHSGASQKTNYQRWEHRILCYTMDVKTFHPPNWEELHRMELARGSGGASRFETMSRIDIPDSSEARYENVAKATNSKLDPGQYADVHTARMVWKWTWLG